LLDLEQGDGAAVQGVTGGVVAAGGDAQAARVYGVAAAEGEGQGTGGWVGEAGCEGCFAVV
jgi:hypothetical protein